MESTESLISSIDLFNIIMVLGIVGLLFAIRDIGKENKILHESNLRERERDRALYGDSAGSDAP